MNLHRTTYITLIIIHLKVTYHIYFKIMSDFGHLADKISIGLMFILRYSAILGYIQISLT